MGFGLIFLGWATLLCFKVLPVGIIGAILMLKGLLKLSSYGEAFKRAAGACCALLIYFTVFGVLWTLDITGVFRFTEIAALVFADEIIYYSMLVIFSILLYRALGDISRTVGFDKGIAREKKCISLVIVFVCFTLLRVALSPLGLDAYMRAALVVFELVWLIYSAVYIYSCYMMIATQEIIDDEIKKMREYDEKYSFRKRKR